MNLPAKDLSLAEKIAECQKNVGKTYGYRRVQIWLEKQGICKSPKTVLRVMRRYGLLSVIRQKKYRVFRQSLNRYPNRFNRDFYANRPNLKWVTDISCIQTGQGPLYLSVIRDLYDNSIVAYQTGTEQNVGLVLSTVRAAKKKEKSVDGVQLHSDQGAVYTSWAFCALTKAYCIIPSMSRRGNPYDNAPAENFFSILKSECISRVVLRSYEEARFLIEEYIYFYNHKRIQFSTKMTPLEKRNRYFVLNSL